ncbi:hypothetical protein DX887_24070 [Vibrio alginolyticus]|nr:hypothetical protein [Vibrio alginolyticus]EJV5744074.1 hypothetical protein [Vibrio alginolyticus]EKD1483008.1 hypothetical protein [Vibrio alginolyticus]
MKHETINSIIGILGLGIASVTAYHQFVPPSDTLEIEVTPVPSNQPLKELVQFQDGLTDEVRKLSGPFFWKFTAYNSLDRTVTIKEIHTKLLSDVGGLIDYGDLSVGTFDRDLAPLHLPVSIDAHEAKVIFLALNIPVKYQEQCEISNSTVNDLEKCYYQYGHDLFGNKVESLATGIVRWEGIPKSPSFISTVKTGDNSELRKTLNYFPFNP